MISICKERDSQQHQNDDACQITEYPTNLTQMNMAVGHIYGRYPTTGYVSNQLVDEMLYIQSGEGYIKTIDGETTHFAEGDVVAVPKLEKYFFEGDFFAVIACTPAFTPEQHEHIAED